MVESPQLRSAREHLARAEANYRSDDGLFHLEEGLALLEDIIAGPDAGASRIAANVLATYAGKIYAVADRAVATDPNLPEPELEHLFKLILAFDPYSFELPLEARKTKFALASRLVDRYLEGHSPEEKRAASERLAGIAGGTQPTAPGEKSKRRRKT